MPDFYSQINEEDPAAEFRSALVALLDAMLQSGMLSDEQKGQIARLRARVQIDLTEFD